MKAGVMMDLRSDTIRVCSVLGRTGVWLKRCIYLPGEARSALLFALPIARCPFHESCAPCISTLYF